MMFIVLPIAMYKISKTVLSSITGVYSAANSFKAINWNKCLHVLYCIQHSNIILILIILCFVFSLHFGYCMFRRAFSLIKKVILHDDEVKYKCQSLMDLK